MKEGKLTFLKKQETWCCFKSNTSTVDNEHTYPKERPGNRFFPNEYSALIQLINGDM